MHEVVRERGGGWVRREHQTRSRRHPAAGVQQELTICALCCVQLAISWPDCPMPQHAQVHGDMHRFVEVTRLDAIALEGLAMLT